MLPEERETEERENMKTFLERFPVNMRSHVANLFYSAVRAGCSEIESIVEYVKARVRGRYASVTMLIEDYREEAENFARYVIKRESLPQEIRAREKMAKSEYYRAEYMKTLPPTKKQLKYLRGLGCKRKVMNRWEACQLIDHFKKIE